MRFITVQTGMSSSSVFVDCGYYTTVQDFIDAINKAFLNKLQNENIKFSFNPRTGKVKVTLAPDHKVAFFGNMSTMLGYGGETTKVQQTRESPYIADLFRITAIYVYCDIVQPQIVGDTSAPSLRTIPVSEKSGEVITKTFTNTQYVPVTKRTVITCTNNTSTNNNRQNDGATCKTTPENNHNNKTATRDSPIILIGDSMIKNINPRKISRRQIIKRTFPGKTAEEIKHEINTISPETAPSHIIIHAGTNNLPKNSMSETVKHVEELANCVKQRFPNSQIGLSSIIN